MSKIQEALEKVNLLKQIDSEIKAIESCNMNYKKILNSFKQERPNTISFNSSKGNISMNFDMVYTEKLFDELIKVNQKQIKSLKNRLIKLL